MYVCMYVYVENYTDVFHLSRSVSLSLTHTHTHIIFLPLSRARGARAIVVQLWDLHLGLCWFADLRHSYGLRTPQQQLLEEVWFVRDGCSEGGEWARTSGDVEVRQGRF